MTGELNLKMGGAPVVPPLEREELFGMIGKPENAWMVTPDAAEHNRRTIYMLVAAHVPAAHGAGVRWPGRRADLPAAE